MNKDFFFDEFYILHINIWIDFNKKEVQYIDTRFDKITSKFTKVQPKSPF